MAEAKKTPVKAATKTAAKKTATKTAAKAPAKTAAKTAAKKVAPTHQEIAALAYTFWQERGGRHGSDAQDWLRAERELGVK